MESLLQNSDFEEYLVDRSQFVDVIERVMASKAHEGLDLAEFEADPTWRTRLRELPFNPDGIINHKTAAGAWDMVGAALHEATKELQEQQGNGEWALVGWEITSQTMLRRDRRPRETPPPEAVTKVAGIARPLPPSVFSVDRLEEGMAKVPRILVRVAFVDLARSPELDMWANRTGKTDAPMHGGKIPARLRAEYAEARVLILRKPAEHALTDREKAKIDKLVAKDFSVDDIAETLSIPVSAILAYVAPAPPTAPEPRRRGKGA